MKHKFDKKHILITSVAIITLMAPIALAGCSNNNNSQSKPKTAHVVNKDNGKISKETIKYLDKQRKIVFEEGDNTPRNSDKKFHDARQRVRIWKRNHTSAQWKYYIKHSSMGPEGIPKGQASEYDTNIVNVKAVADLGVAIIKANQSSYMGDSDSTEKMINAVSQQGLKQVKAWKKKYGKNAYTLSTIELTDAKTDSDGARGKIIEQKVQAGLAPIKQKLGTNFQSTGYQLEN